MINEIFSMNGYGFTFGRFLIHFFSLTALYMIIKIQYVKERNKFIIKFGTLNSERAAAAKSHSINKEILSNTSRI